MYRVTGIKLHNICQYADMSVDLATGLTAVTGPNGMGKSTLLRALVYGLTGQVDGLWGTQKDLQKDMTADPGYVDVSFTDGADRYAVRRFSVAMSAKFPDAVTRNGSIVVQKRRAVDAFMESVFGMPCQLMFQVCWSRQGELSQLLTAPSAIVSTFLGKVFDTSSLERLREKLKSAADSVAQLPSACLQTLQRDRQALDDARGALASLPDVDDLRRRLAAAEDDCSALSVLIKSGVTAEDKDARLASLSEERRLLQAAIAGLETASDASVPAEWDGDLAADRASAAACLSDMRDRKARHDAYVAVFSRRQDELHERIVASDARVAELDARLSGNLDTCPLCGSAVDDPDAHKDDICRFLTGSDYTSFMDACRNDRAAAEKERSALVSEAALEAAEYGDNDAALSEMEGTVAYMDAVDAAMRLSAARRRMELLDTEAESVRALVVVDASIQQRLDAARCRIAELRRGIDAAVSSASDAAANVRMLEQAVADDEASAAQYETNSAVRKALAEMRSIFAQDRAQARYLQSRIRLLNARFAEHLQLTGLPFTVWLDTATRTFVYRTADGVEHSAAHLSGAQKSMAAVALQMALLSVMRPSMNLYLVDEPTEALDDENKVIMSGMFDRMNRLLPAVSGTMLIATRDQAVLEACGNSINVGEQR